MTVEDLRAIPGRVGLWSMELRSAGQAEVRDAASELDGLGFRALWIPGGDGTRVFGDSGRLLQAAPHPRSRWASWASGDTIRPGSASTSMPWTARTAPARSWGSA